MIHAMVDIETLGVGKDAPLFEIGVQLFDIDTGTEIGYEHWHVDIMDVMWQTGRCPQPDTLDWWRKQTYDPSKEVDRVTLSDALFGMTSLWDEHPIEMTWANSPSFDLIILDGHFRTLGWFDAPWSYRQELDFRTMRWAAKRKGWVQPEAEPSHNALEDCRLQTKLLMEMLNV